MAELIPFVVGSYITNETQLCRVVAVNDPRGQYIVVEDAKTLCEFVLPIKDFARWRTVTPLAS